MIHEREYQHHIFCQTYGHHWQAISQCGKYVCSNCQIVGYCPGCLPHMPTGACLQRMRRGERR